MDKMIHPNVSRFHCTSLCTDCLSGCVQRRSCILAFFHAAIYVYTFIVSVTCVQGDLEFDGDVVGVGMEGRMGEGAEGGVNLLFLGMMAVLVLLIWWTCRRPRKKPRGRRSLIAKFPIV